jgi:SAM-dependent methyltransferase
VTDERTPEGDEPAGDEPAVGEASRLMSEVRERAESGDAGATGSSGTTGSDPVADIPSTIAAARHHLDVAWHSSDAGTEIPDAARMRQVKRAVMVGLRPVTSHQVPFNRELTIAVDRLATTVEALATQVGHTEGPLAATIRRVQAGIATVELGAAELDDEVAALSGALDDARARLAAAEEALAEQRERIAALERTAPPTTTARPAATAPASDAGGGDDRRDALVRRLARAARPAADDLRAWARAVGDAVVDATADAPLLDLASDRGEWLATWRELGVEATGVDDDPAALDLLATADLPAVAADPIAHLGGLPRGTLGAISAAALADVVPLEVLLTALQAAGAALRPGGVLVLLLADPATLATGDPQWADPRRRAVPAATVERLLLDSGWSEVDVLPVGGDGAEAARAAVVVARTPGGPSTA